MIFENKEDTKVRLSVLLSLYNVEDLRKIWNEAIDKNYYDICKMVKIELLSRGISIDIELKL